MRYVCEYHSPIGELILEADGDNLVGIWFADSKYSTKVLNGDREQLETAVITQTKQWLDIYFQGKQPNFTPKLNLIGTDFQKDVWNILLQIPFGKTVAYGDIATQLAAAYGLKRMSAQAVGQAVGRNPIGIIVPCHRVVGANGSLTGYAGGIDKKAFLLQLERAEA